VFIAVIVRSVSSLPHRKITPVSLHLHTERRSVTIPEDSDNDALYMESLTLWDLHIRSCLKIAVKGQQNNLANKSN